jgi:hypothetical protein
VWAYDEEADLLRLTITHPDLAEPMVIGITEAAYLELGRRIVNGEQPEQLT